jgi:hypothetical protein
MIVSVDAVRLELTAASPHYHTHMVTANGVHADSQKGVYKWYRADTGGQFTPIARMFVSHYWSPFSSVFELTLLCLY